MAFRKLALNALVVNRANDRHGELENETVAIAWLFNEREAHMRSLAKDIVEQGEIYEYPLVSPEKSKFIVFDGNRRVTCFKLLDDPRRAPTTAVDLVPAAAAQAAFSTTSRFPAKAGRYALFGPCP